MTKLCMLYSDTTDCTPNIHLFKERQNGKDASSAFRYDYVSPIFKLHIQVLYRLTEQTVYDGRG